MTIIYKTDYSEEINNKKNAQFVASLEYVKALVCFDVSKQSKSKETKEKSMKHAFSFLQTQCLIKDLTKTRAYFLKEHKAYITSF